MLLVKMVKFLRVNMRARHAITRFEPSKQHLPPSAPRLYPGGERYACDGHRLFSEFFQNGQGLWIYTRRWQVPHDTETKGLVLLVHGFGEHSGRYDLVARTLAARGLEVHALDHQGHGRSEGDRAYTERLSHMVDDVITIGQRAVAQHRNTGGSPNTPLFLLGHSMGGLITTHAAARAEKEIPGGLRGVVLSSPALMEDPDAAGPVLIAIGKVLSKVLPKAPLDPLPGHFVSRDPLVVEQYKNDPLNYCGGLRARIGIEMLHGMHDIQARASQLTWPMLLLQAEKDKLVNPAGAAKFSANKGGTDNEFHMLPGQFHELFNEPEGEEHLERCLTWMLDRV
jgi:alpha-beta hydrolase superfamily lysophospholipase